MDRPPSLSTDARDAILAWYLAHGRQLAFRETTDPYAILVSEAMAQQTQAARAAAHWERFMARFPTIAALAGASPADVLREWQGLGYNRRATALWRVAGRIVAEHGGRVPDSLEELEALPGIGPYTARAVAAIAFGRPVGAVDTNVRRVLGRLVAGGPNRMRGSELQAVADRAVPPADPAAWTHALMDLGATICRPRSPGCDACPVRAWCRFATEERPPEQAAATTDRRSRSPSFPATTRWLRGRILDLLRAAPGDTWIDLDVPIGSHDLAQVRSAATAMAADGLVEIEATTPTSGMRARLATA